MKRSAPISSDPEPAWGSGRPAAADGMSEGTGDQSSAPPEVLVRVQAISDLKAFKRHLLRMFDQGQPRYPDRRQLAVEHSALDEPRRADQVQTG